MIVRAQEKKEGGGPDLPDLPEIPTPSSGGKSLFDQVDDFGRKISKETQEASGLDARKLGQQPGDKTGVQFGKEDTPKGEVGREYSCEDPRSLVWSMITSTALSRPVRSGADGRDRFVYFIHLSPYQLLSGQRMCT